MNITVYLGAHEGNDPIYKKAVEELGIWIADNGNRLVYGGSDEGLMAVIADTVLAHDGDVTGIEAQMFVDRGVAHHNLTQLVVVPNIVERRTRMIELGDVFIAFPGGTGTLEEISEVVSKICLDQLTQPCIFYNLNGFYDDMKAFLQHMIDAGFSTAERQHGIYFASLQRITHRNRQTSDHRQNSVQNRHERQPDNGRDGQREACEFGVTGQRISEFCGENRYRCECGQYHDFSDTFIQRQQEPCGQCDDDAEQESPCDNFA